MRWKESILLALILLGAFTVRLYRFNNPVADWHSWRQADTSSVSRNFVKYGFDLLHPRMNNISNVQSGKENPMGYFYAEFPLYNAAQAGLFITFHHFTIEEWGRLVTIGMSCLSIVFLYFLGKRYIGRLGGLLAAFFFAFVPFSIYYSRVILPDPSMVAATLGAILFLDISLSSKTRKRGLSLLAISLLLSILALLFKPYAIFFLVPTMLYQVFKKYSWKLLLRLDLWVYAILAVIPLGLWRLYMQHYPEGIPANAWLFNEGNIRFTGAYFYWLFAERISKLILGYWGIAIVFLGMLWTKKKNVGFFVSFLVGSLLYMVVIARGNVQHDYYQILIVPTLALFFGLGGDFLLQLFESKTNKWLGGLLFIVCTLFMLSFGWYNVRDYFNINNPNMIIAGQAVDALTPKNAKVIAPLDGDSSFLYQTNRQGWASFDFDLPVLIKLGADYMILVNPTQNDYNGFGKQYKVVSSSSAYLLLDLHQKQ
ncbi:MAG TPA: glycosyltransferase family 39 protein [Candidatus Saccharimonadales bacterium]|nr:glycosyltransferase family 39 protein [Candidatus Saccharimonadales bacterium]